VGEEALSGVIGGTLSTWNQPFEVLRIEAQAAASKGLPPRNIVQTFKHVVKESGYIGLFQGEMIVMMMIMDTHMRVMMMMMMMMIGMLIGMMILMMTMMA